MSDMTNDAYRKSRGTDKPFTGSDEQVKAIWDKSLRKEKWRSAKETSAPAPAPTA